MKKASTENLSSVNRKVKSRGRGTTGEDPADFFVHPESLQRSNRYEGAKQFGICNSSKAP